MLDIGLCQIYNPNVFIAYWNIAEYLIIICNRVVLIKVLYETCYD